MFVAHIVIILLLIVLALLFAVAWVEMEFDYALFLAFVALGVYGIGWAIGVLPPLTVVARMLF